MSGRLRGRGWVFTHQLGYNLTEADAKYVDFGVHFQKQLDQDEGQPHWFFWRVEKGASTGEYHVQGAAYFYNPKSAKTVNQWFPHYNQKMKGTIDQQINYITKQETWAKEFGEPVEIGKRPESNGEQGKRTDLWEVKVI